MAVELDARIETLRRELSVWDDAAIAMHWVAADGTILWANQTELDTFGYTREQYIGHAICEFHVDPAACAEILRLLLAGEALHDYAARLRHADGSVCEVRIDSNGRWREGAFDHTRCFTRPAAA